MGQYFKMKMVKQQFIKYTFPCMFLIHKKINNIKICNYKCTIWPYVYSKEFVFLINSNVDYKNNVLFLLDFLIF